MWDLRYLGSNVSGPDTPHRQKAFDQKYNLGIPLLSNLDHEVAEAYGTWAMKSVQGRMKEGIIRSSFLIDDNGTILQATYNVKPEEAVPRAQEAIAWASLHAAGFNARSRERFPRLRRAGMGRSSWRREGRYHRRSRCRRRGCSASLSWKGPSSSRKSRRCDW